MSITVFALMSQMFEWEMPIFSKFRTILWLFIMIFMGWLKSRSLPSGNSLIWGTLCWRRQWTECLLSKSRNLGTLNDFNNNSLFMPRAWAVEENYRDCPLQGHSGYVSRPWTWPRWGRNFISDNFFWSPVWKISPSHLKYQWSLSHSPYWS